MKVEIISRDWPHMPKRREIKISIDDAEITSSFMNSSEVWDLANQLRYISYNLMYLGNALHEEEIG